MYIHICYWFLLYFVYREGKREWKSLVLALQP